eukprot:jgi/Tetstr1/431052/TSEL_020769.t1
MHLAYAPTFDPSVYLVCGRCSAITRRLLPQPLIMPPSHTARWCATCDVYRKMPRTPMRALHPPHAPTDPEYSPPEEPPDLRRAPPSWGGDADDVRRWGKDQRRVLRRAPRLSVGHVDWWPWEHIRDLDVPSWRLWVNRCLAGRCHSRTAAFLASGTVFALHKDDPAAREERAKTGEPLRVRPLGVGSVLVRVASAHVLVQVGAGAREAMGPTGFLSRMMPPSELDPFLEAVDAANSLAALSLLGLDACLD